MESMVNEEYPRVCNLVCVAVPIECNVCNLKSLHKFIFYCYWPLPFRAMRDMEVLVWAKWGFAKEMLLFLQKDESINHLIDHDRLLKVSS